MIKVFGLLSMLLLAAIGLSFASEGDSSPLAIWDASGDRTFLATAAGNGMLRVTDTCVFLETKSTDGATILLAWPEPTSWNAETEEITFVSPVDGSTTVLKNGDQVLPGGADAQEGFDNYVLAPDASCEADSVFIVHSIDLLD